MKNALESTQRQQAEVARALLGFIHDDFQPLAAIAQHLGMNEDNVRKTYLERLIDAGLVVRKFKAKRARGQAYKAVASDETQI